MPSEWEACPHYMCKLTGLEAVLREDDLGEGHTLTHTLTHTHTHTHRGGRERERDGETEREREREAGRPWKGRGEAAGATCGTGEQTHG